MNLMTKPMDNRFLKISGLILLFLALLVALPWIGGKFDRSQNSKAVPSSVDLSGLTQASVSKLVIQNGDKQVTLEFKDGKWLVGSDEADGGKVNQLFQAFADLENKGMAAQKADNQSKFGVGKDGTFTLTVTQNGQEQRFFIGNAAQTPGDFYLRRDGIVNVYLVSGQLRDILGWDASKWKKAADAAADQGGDKAPATGGNPLTKNVTPQTN